MIAARDSVPCIWSVLGAVECGISLGQLATEEKSNEITAIPQLLDQVELKGSIVTIDAAGCQKEIAAKIVAGGGDYCLGLKGNQGNLHEAVTARFAAMVLDDFSAHHVDMLEYQEKKHGREDRPLCLLPVRRAGGSSRPRTVEETEDSWCGPPVEQMRGEGNQRPAILHQFLAPRCEAICQRGTRPLGNRELAPLVLGCHVSRRREPFARETPDQQHRMAQTLRHQPTQTGSR